MELQKSFSEIKHNPSQYVENVRLERGRYVWVSGYKPRFKVGDVLAPGKIMDINFSDLDDDWIYDFGNGVMYSEEYIITEESAIRYE